MIKSYLTVALRWLYRDRKYAAINILSLTLGFTCFLVLSAYVFDQLFYDRHFPQHASIYRLISVSGNSAEPSYARSPSGYVPMLLSENPGLDVLAYTRFRPSSRLSVQIGEGHSSTYLDHVYLSDNTVFDTFSLDILYGDKASALTEPDSIAISESTAVSLFGNKAATGRVLSTATNEYRVTLVYADPPANTHFKYNALLSYRIFTNRVPDSRMTLRESTDYTYLVAGPDFDRTVFNAASARFYEDNIRLDFEDAASRQFIVQPLADTHFNTDLLLDEPHGNRYYTLGVLLLSFVVLVVSFINFINISMATSEARTREALMRRLMGADRWQLIAQFSGESLMLTLLSLAISFVLIVLVLPILPLQGSGSDLDVYRTLTQPEFMLVLALFIAVSGLLAGFIPACHLAGNAIPSRNITSKIRMTKGLLSAGDILFSIQVFFAIALAGIAGIVSSQIDYMLDAPLGYESERRIVLSVRADAAAEEIRSARNGINQIPGVTAYAMSSWVPGFQPDSDNIHWRNTAGLPAEQRVRTMQVDHDFLDVMGIAIVHGRGFEQTMVNDSAGAVVVNRTLADLLRLHEDDNLQVNYRGVSRDVVGIVEDFYVGSMHSEIEPLLVLLADDSVTPLRNMVAVLERTSVEQTLSDLARYSEETGLSGSFEYRFISDIVGEQYAEDRVIGNITRMLSISALVISMLGLLGLVLLVLRRRAREFAVRRVLGISGPGLFTVVNRNFVMAFLLVTPLSVLTSYLISSAWLENFPYRIVLQAGDFLVPLVVVATSLVSVTSLSFFVQTNRLSTALKDD